MDHTHKLLPGNLSLEIISRLLNSTIKLNLTDKDIQKINASRKTVENVIKSKKKIYGINTGFGLLAAKEISNSELTKLQRNLILSHAAGTGPSLSNDIVKLILLLKINSLSRGFSGVRPLLIERLITFYNTELYPTIPSKGSVGASGDLAPLAHLSLPLIGEGTVSYKKNIISADKALQIAKIKPLQLAAKEGLALINGTQVSTAIALYNLIKAQKILSAAVVIGCITVDGALGCIAPFNKNIHILRNQFGQIQVANKVHNLLKNSQLQDSHANCGRVQDPYSLRCQPQVLGASLDNLKHTENILTIEANAVTDNPIVFTENNEILSGGNFHAEPVAQAADIIAISLAEIGALAERRIALLMDPHFNGNLPAFLVNNSGINSGFMIAHVTASSLASANKSLSHPVSIDSLPTSANQEDHVSMATYAAFRLGEINCNVETILAIELLAAAQAIDLRQPLETSNELQIIIKQLRDKIPFWNEDRIFAPDIEKAKEMILPIGEKHQSSLFNVDI